MIAVWVLMGIVIVLVACCIKLRKDVDDYVGMIEDYKKIVETYRVVIVKMKEDRDKQPRKEGKESGDKM